MGKYPFVTDFNVIVCPPKRAEATADTLRALYIVSKASECAIYTWLFYVIQVKN